MYWIADVLGLSERALRYARMELIRLGWFESDTGLFRRKPNRGRSNALFSPAERVMHVSEVGFAGFMVADAGGERFTKSVGSFFTGASD